MLAVVIVPLALITLGRALRGRFARHRRIARWTWPIWMYVSVTGVVVYLMVYRIYPHLPPGDATAAAPRARGARPPRGADRAERASATVPAEENPGIPDSQTRSG